MGSKLTGFFEEAKKVAGMKGQMRMAMLTGVSSQKAVAEADSPELVKKFTDALAQIKKEA